MGAGEEEIRRNLLLNYWSLRKWARTQNLYGFNQTDKWARTFLLACYISNNIFETIIQPHYTSDSFPKLLSCSPTLQFFSCEQKAVVLIAKDRYLITGLVISRVWEIKICSSYDAENDGASQITNVIQSRVSESAHLFSPLNLWESLFAARFGRLSTYFSWLVPKVNSEYFPDIFIPSVSQSHNVLHANLSGHSIIQCLIDVLKENNIWQCLKDLKSCCMQAQPHKLPGTCCLFATLGGHSWLITALQASCPRVWLVGNDLGKGWERSCFQLAHTSVPAKGLLYSHTQTRYIV